MILQQMLLRYVATVAAGPEWTSLGKLAQGNSGTDGSGTGSVSVTANQALAAGKVVIMTAAMSPSASALYGNCTDSAGNTWTLVTKSQGYAFYYSKLTNAMTTSSTITISVTGQNGSFGVISGLAWAFSIPAGKTVNLAASPIISSSGTATDSLTLSGLTSREYLFFRYELVNIASAPFTITPTTGYAVDSYTKQNQEGVYGEYTIATGTGSTSNPSGATNASTVRYIFAAFYLT